MNFHDGYSALGIQTEVFKANLKSTLEFNHGYPYGAVKAFEIEANQITGIRLTQQGVIGMEYFFHTNLFAFL